MESFQRILNFSVYFISEYFKICFSLFCDYNLVLLVLNRLYLLKIVYHEELYPVFLFTQHQKIKRKFEKLLSLPFFNVSLYFTKEIQIFTNKIILAMWIQPRCWLKKSLSAKNFNSHINQLTLLIQKGRVFIKIISKLTELLQSNQGDQLGPRTAFKTVICFEISS